MTKKEELIVKWDRHTGSGGTARYGDDRQALLMGLGKMWQKNVIFGRGKISRASDFM